MPAVLSSPRSAGCRLPATTRAWLVVVLAVAFSLHVSTTSTTAESGGDEVCVTSEVDGASGRLCVRREGFGVVWAVELTDTADDGRQVKARIGLDVEAGRDVSAEVESDAEGAVVSEQGRLAPRIGRSLRSVSIDTCVEVRFARDRCEVATVTLPQLPSTATAAQQVRLDELIFDMPVERFIEVWSADDREGVDATFDWTSDGCSAGPFRELFDERLQWACIRHDFAYRNLGQMGLVPTDELRRRVDAQLAADIEALGGGVITGGFEDTLQRFGGPVFYGDDLAELWGVPDFVVTRLGTPELREE